MTNAKIRNRIADFRRTIGIENRRGCSPLDYSDSRAELLELKSFLDSIKARFVDVLPYHNLGERKLVLTGMEGGTLSRASMKRAEAIERACLLEGEGRVVTVGGEPVCSL